MRLGLLFLLLTGLAWAQPVVHLHATPEDAVQLVRRRGETPLAAPPWSRGPTHVQANLEPPRSTVPVPVEEEEDDGGSVVPS